MTEPIIKTLFATGHRKIGRAGIYEIDHPDRLQTRAYIRSALFGAITIGGFNTFISGMALGFDQDFALSVLGLKAELGADLVHLVCALPFNDFYFEWNLSTRKLYKEILEQADAVVQVNPPGFAKWKYQARNEFMVDQSEQGLALWHGTAGGTANCIRYAVNQNKLVRNLLDLDILENLGKLDNKEYFYASRELP